MAMEHCLLQMSTARPGVALQCYHPNGVASRPKLNSTTCKALEGFSVPALSTSVSSFGRSAGALETRTSRLVCKARDAVDEVQVVTDSSWSSLVVGSDNPVLVEFWAPWCGPCRMIAPVIDELAKEYAGKISCYKLNTDDCPNIATQYGIRSIPTVLFFKNGEKKESVIGAVPKSTLSATIEKYVDS